MLYFWVSAKHAYTIRTFLDGIDGALNDVITVIAGSEVNDLPSMMPGNIVFSDIDRLETETRNVVIILNKFIEQSREKGCEIRYFNHPARTMRRFDLLRTLHGKGINPFNVYSVWELDRNIRFPVFIRCRNDHDGARTALINDRKALIRKLQRAINFDAPENLMIVEFVETAEPAEPAPVYRKYGAFLIGDMLIPRQVQFRHEWCVKVSALKDEQFIRQEVDYVSSPIPHESQLREVFRLAEVGYGRVDYTVHDGRVVVWEINTNPMIIGFSPEEGPRKQVTDIVVPKLIEGLKQLDYRAGIN